MTSSIPAFCTPAVLKWARESAGASLEAAARRVGKTADDLTAWESGASQPTIAQLRQLCELYRRPLAVFFLPEPPRDFSTLRDFRRLPTGQSREFSPELRYLIRWVRERQEWAREFRREGGTGPLRFVKSATLRDAASVLANRIRNLLKVTDNVQRSWRKEDEAFDQWCRNCELAGVFVLQSSDVALEEMRGFALPDRFAPALLVNSRDSRGARIFTLLHEFAHLLIGAEGISNLDIPRKATTDEDRTEVFCNALAAETLLPSGLFEEEWRGLQVHDLDEAIQRAAKTFSVSREVVARRLRNLKVLSEEEYLERRERYREEFARARQTGTGFLPHLKHVLRDNGNAFTRLVLSAYGDERITGRDVSHLLRVKLNHLGQIETHAFAI